MAITTRSAIILFCAFAAALHHAKASFVEEVRKISTTSVRRSRCDWPGKKIIRSDFEPMRKSEDGTIITFVSVDSIKHWMKCVGHIKRSEARKMLYKLKQKFLRTEGGKEILKMSNCAPEEVLRIFDVNATPAQGRKAGECLMSVFKTQDGRPDIAVVVRIDQDCEREKRNKIRDALARAVARLAAAAAAGLRCSATPASGGLAVAWCSVFAGLAAATLEAEAELLAAQNMECPACSDDVVSRVLQVGEEGYRTKILQEGGSYNRYYGRGELEAPGI